MRELIREILQWVVLLCSFGWLGFIIWACRANRKRTDRNDWV